MSCQKDNANINQIIRKIKDTKRIHLAINNSYTIYDHTKSVLAASMTVQSNTFYESDTNGIRMFKTETKYELLKHKN